jgi:hypothetical protein
MFTRMCNVQKPIKPTCNILKHQTKSCKNSWVMWNAHDFRLLLLCKWDLLSSDMLHNTDRYLVTDVSGQPIGPILKGQENGTNKLSCNASN